MIYTLIYFKPSASGYDYTDGYIDSDNEISVSLFDCAYKAAHWMADVNAKIYNDGTLNRPSYNYINEPEYEFKLLVNGLCYWSDERCNLEGVNWDEIQDVEAFFSECYYDKYNELVKAYKYEKERSNLIKKNKELSIQQERRYNQFLELRKEFE